MKQTGYQKYVFKGAVTDAFSRVLCTVWIGSTYAQSAAKALCNLSYQFKKHAGLASGCRIHLCGSVQPG